MTIGKITLDFPKVLFLVFVAVWLIAANNPLQPYVWWLENIAIVIFLPVVILSYHKFRLSNFSYFLIFLFAAVHVATAHYTYGDSPWGDWLSGLFGMERNHFDRIMHFVYGAVMSPVLIDLLKNYLPARRWVRYLLVAGLVIAGGTLYEIGEFIVGITARPEMGLDFLGLQGDVWDTQKDMGLQAIGAFIGLFLSRLFKK